MCILPGAASTALGDDFTGLHIGLVVGHTTGAATIDTLDIPVGGPITGIEIGGDVQFGNGIVLGLSAGVDRDSTQGDMVVGNWMVYEGAGDISARVMARAGYAVENILPYVTAGVAYTQTTASITCPAGATGGDCMSLGPFTTSADDARFGYSVGAGVEVALTEHVSLKTEYLYSDYGTAPMALEFPAPIGEQTADVAISSSTIRAGISLRF
jgi:outer membrane immunogenic protein